MTDRHLLCLSCGNEATVDNYAPPPGCPTCGAKTPPADLDDMVTIRLSRHELRILTYWAEQHAHAIDGHKAVHHIVDRLVPQVGDTPLLLTHELAQLRAEYGQDNVKVYDASGNEVTDL